ncbi:hypothetical protein AB1Y20_018964 [Prymnesium parvum]|uniref:Queuosine salvage protein n=1 Tax=Prymnesium parvum TaxID=97485 RepID=A0AB34JST4_PRYPA
MAPHSTRRLLLAVSAWAASTPSNPALAARGAAELDLEYYARSLLGRRAPPAVPRAAVAAGRPLDPPLAALLLHRTAEAIAAAVALPADELHRRADARRASLSVEIDRLLSTGAFGEGFDASFAEGGVVAGGPSEQYAFDLSLCALFSQLADARLRRAELAEFNLRLGTALLRALRVDARARELTFAELIRGLRELLGRLQVGGYMREFDVDDSDGDEELWAQRSELSTTKLKVSLTDSAALRSCLLLNGRVSPELASLMVLAFLREASVRVVDMSEYFLDDTYRPNPMEYRPTQFVLDLSIAPRE